MDNASKVLYNLGIGQGMSVRELIAATKRVTGVDFKVTEAPRVEGEAAEVRQRPLALSLRAFSLRALA